MGNFFTSIKLLLFLLLLCACNKKTEKVPSLKDFDYLMGNWLPSWQYMQTKEDLDNFQFYQSIFEKNHFENLQSSGNFLIPKTIHFIWLGPKPFPMKSVENVKSWIACHPTWKVKFWTDRERPLPHPSMEKAYVKDFSFAKLEKFYMDSDNYGEKSDLLRYEILFQEGGVYVDHDVKCTKSFDLFNQLYDLYCGLQLPSKTCLSSSILLTNNILASKPGHPILMNCFDWLKDNWDQIEKDYPGKDRDSVISRVAHRTFFVLGECFKKYANMGGNRDIAFPALFFNAPDDMLAIYARHTYAGTWFENETEFEKMVRKRLMMVSKKMNKLFLFLAVVSGLNLAGFGALFWYMRKGRQQR
ncbi:MAG: hypothetical protein L0207_01415 [Chlamydiae bacterium]|nr:hypothetical protein [Chlamydiota bacterium]